jgi:hypothetical protein
VRLLIAGAVAAVLASDPSSFAKDPSVKARYCTQAANGSWSLNQFKPLIKVQGGTVFAEMSFEGNMLVEVRLRRFFTDSELAFDYTFDASGKLTGLKGSVSVQSTGPTLPGDTDPPLFANWLGEAELMPGRDGKIPAHHVLYSREKDHIDKPDNAETYVGRFNDAPIFWTTKTVPCAAMLKEAEKMNATQE